MRPNRNTALRWLRQATHDLRIARGHQERGDYSDACFMAEQAAQKALKGFLMAQGQRAITLQGERAVAAVQAIVSLVTQKVPPPQES